LGETEMEKFFLIFCVLLLIVGCTNSTYDKAMEQAKLSLANGEYDKALGLFELATNEEPKEQNAKEQYDVLKDFLKVQEMIENKQWDVAISKANNLLKKESLTNQMEKELKKNIEISEAGISITEQINQIKVLVNAQKYIDAQQAINHLKQNEEAKEIFVIFSEEVRQIEGTVDKELKKQKEETEKLAAEKAATEKAAKEKAKAEKEKVIVWDTYENDRYAFTIKYPEGWTGGPEATNGDGRALYQQNNTEVIAYGTMYFEEFKPDLSNYKKVSTNQGYVAYYREESGQNPTFSGYILNNEAGTEFHLVATMDQKFAQKHSKVLLQMLKSAELGF
jgi:vacuolar-type H+-ATPase subunit I/STV1